MADLWRPTRSGTVALARQGKLLTFSDPLRRELELTDMRPAFLAIEVRKKDSVTTPSED